MPKSKLTATKIALWSMAISAILVVGVLLFPKEEPGLKFWGSLYYTLRLFIFEHDLSHFPNSPLLAFIYFLAPVVSLSALGTAITYLFRLSPAVQTRFKQDHVVVCGVGRTGKLLAETLKERGIPVVGVDSGCPDEFEQWGAETHVPMIHGDFLLQATLEKAGVQRARAVIFASGDDLVNLEAAVGLYSWLPQDQANIRLIWVHIAHEKLAETARKAIRTKGPVSIRFFDTYRIAATRMIARHFTEEISSQVQKVNILGFGKFGRDLLEIIVVAYGPKPPWSIAVMDLKDRKSEVSALAEELGVADRVEFVRDDIRNLHVDPEKHAYFLCTDDDIGNLSMALMITDKRRHCPIFVRMAKWPLPAIEDHLNGNYGITFTNINQLVKKGIEELPGIFGKAEASDMKRSVS